MSQKKEIEDKSVESEEQKEKENEEKWRVSKKLMGHYQAVW